MNQKHSEPFYISPKLFENRRLKRRCLRWMERLRERQQFYMTQMRANELTAKVERGKRNCELFLPRRRVATTLPADITIDLLSDDENIAKGPPTTTIGSSLYVHTQGGLQLSMVPNITLVPVHLTPVNSSTMLLMPACSNTLVDGKRQRKAPKPRRRHGYVSSTSTPIVLTSDDDDEARININTRHTQRSPPPLAPLTLSETVEEVTVSLVPRNATTANCHARQQRRRHPRHSPCHSQHNGCSTPTSSSMAKSNGYLDVDVGGSVAATLPDETTVHTVIANRIYELSLSKLREGLASSGVPEYTQDLLPEQLQKLSPAMRAKVAPMVVSSPPAPISLKLSSDLSISLISDDDECENGNTSGGGASIELVHPVVAAEAHAAAKLLKQQQPQLSVVQHLQYAGTGRDAPVALALPVVAQATVASNHTGRRHKLG